jgi:hypothetical protein
VKYRSGSRVFESPTRRVKFIPVKDGDLIDMGDTGLLGVSNTHKLVGFKAAGGKKLGGWLVILVDEAVKAGRPHKKHSLKAVA